MALVLNDDHVAQLMPMSDCIQVLEDAFRDMGQGRAVNAERRESLMISKTRPEAYYTLKTIEGGLETLGVMAQRINSDLRNRPTVDGVDRRAKVPAAPGNRYVGLVFLYSSETLELLAIMTDGHLQRMRVAGTTGVGAKYLAREDSRVVGLFGSGWQAETAAWALAAIRPITTIRVFSPNQEHRKAFAKQVASDLGIEVIPVNGAESAVVGADIVATATNSLAAVVRGEWVESGMHLTCIRRSEFEEKAWQGSDLILFSGPPGSEGISLYSSGSVETGPISRKADYLVEMEDGLFQEHRNKIHFLSDLLVGKAPKRTTSSQITLMAKSRGIGIEFASTAKLVYDRARAAGIGREIPTEWFSQTSHP